MKIDAAFLRLVQSRGWIVDYADQVSVIGKCPRAGCSVKLRLVPGKSVPETCTGPNGLLEFKLDSFRDAAGELRDARERNMLTIKEVEECAGLATDHLAKIERDGSDRVPNLDTFINWAQALGYEVVLRRGSMPPLTLRTIAESRHQMEDRRSKFSYWGRLRDARRRARSVAGS